MNIGKFPWYDPQTTLLLERGYSVGLEREIFTHWFPMLDHHPDHGAHALLKECIYIYQQVSEVADQSANLNSSVFLRSVAGSSRYEKMWNLVHTLSAHPGADRYLIAMKEMDREWWSQKVQEGWECTQLRLHVGVLGIPMKLATSHWTNVLLLWCYSFAHIYNLLEKKSYHQIV